jgi:hypothetical protein
LVSRAFSLSMRAATAAGTVGASTAAIAYVKGDEEMAASAQAAAATSALNGNMSAIGAERAAAL